MIKELLFASTNTGKYNEVSKYAEPCGIVILSPEEVKVSKSLHPPPVVVEDAGSYLGNARLKAIAYSDWASMPALADDSGLEVAALNNEPGLYTARYAGSDCTPADNRNKMLKAMANESMRAARFCCSLSVVEGDRILCESTGELFGEISSEQNGEGGFGYDPIFIPTGYEQTLAELKALGSDIETHRIQALRKLFELLSV